jgi:hypothetical protein
MPVSVPAALHAKLGDEASKGLVEMLTVSHELAGERFERRLTSEMSGLRVDMHKDLGGVRQEIAQSRVEILKWMIVLWVGNLTATLGVVGLMFRVLGH